MPNFKHLASLSQVILAPALSELQRSTHVDGDLDYLWNRYTDRQDHPLSPHKDTQTIYLRGPRNWTVDDIFDRDSVIDYAHEIEKLPKLYTLAGSLLWLLGVYKRSDIGRIMIVALKPQGTITSHRDEGLYAEYFQRAHLCLQCEEDIDTDTLSVYETFTTDVIDEATKYFEVGDFVWFNHRKHHSARNTSETVSRIHMILDYHV